MKMKNEEMYARLDMLTQIINDPKSQQTGKLAYALTRNKRILEEESKDYIEIRAKAIQKYGKAISESADGKIEYRITPDMKEEWEGFVKEIGDVSNIEIDVDVFTVSEEEFYSGTLTTSQMDSLLWMVADKKGAKK